MVPRLLLEHAHKHHDRILPVYYEKELAVACPYCPQIVGTIGEYMRHMENHPEMLISSAPIHVCGKCGIMSARMYQMIQHWRTGYCTSGSLRFDYGAANNALAVAVALANQRTAAVKRAMPRVIQSQKKPRNG
ncbi:hypothetical protein PENTCL1PPCAC_19863 [Pristionchus entomophagus]|uniref:C2H2-type domain-containing protein n=1 Tax=Pristionchus entomophagus TaxID=358040 RepID=A0AAV5TUM1_9BILA|nr:hypothetical protein PENTCL1PPCAC_19863 [Pristionchus entomophagus]